MDAPPSSSPPPPPPSLDALRPTLEQPALGVPGPGPRTAAARARILGAHGDPDAACFEWAGEPGIIRAHQKDVFYLSQLRELAEPVVRNIFGTRSLHTRASQLNLLLRLLYFGLTTGLGRQTLGEEYTDVRQWDVRHRRWPSYKTRALLILTLPLPELLGALLKGLRSSPAASDPASLRARAARLLQPLASPLLWDTVRTAHLIAFYLGGSFYSIRKRLLGIRYVSTLPPAPQPPGRPARPYEILGLLMALQLIIRLSSHIMPYLPSLPASLRPPERPKPVLTLDGSTLPTSPPSTSLSSDAAGAEEGDAGMSSEQALAYAALPPEEVREADERGLRKCTLCLEGRRATAATECGHLFCWECVMEWGKEKAECPLCRQGMTLDKVWAVYNL